VECYLPDDNFYEWHTGKPIRGEGADVSAEVELTDIMLHYKGGIVYPQRISSANTTTALRTKGFNIVIAPGLDGKAAGSLYLDDGISNIQNAVSEIDFAYADGVLSMTGSFEYAAGVGIEAVTVLGVVAKPDGIENAEYGEINQKLVVRISMPLTGKAKVKVA
jgi:alpha-glucosidase